MTTTTTTKACDTFFSLPELLATLAPFLTKHSLIQLVQVNKHIYAICTPLLWAILNLRKATTLTLFLRSYPGQQALSHNIPLIHAVTWRPIFSWYYINAVWTYLNTTKNLSPDYQAVSVDALAHATCGNMREFPGFLSFSPLPPMRPFLRLTRLETSMGVCSTVKGPETLGYSEDSHLHQILWLVRLNSDTLTHLGLEYLHLTNPRAVRDLCRTVSQLHRLRALRVSAESVRLLTNGRTTLQTFLLCCPRSLAELKIGDWKDKQTFIGEGLDPVAEDWDFDQGPLVLRETALYDVKRLSIPNVMHDEDWAPTLWSILRHCPAVISLQLPIICARPSLGIEPVLSSIGELCPKVSDLSFPSGSLGVHLPRIMEGLTAQGLQTLRCVYGLGFKSMDAAWTRHSASLRRVEFYGCSRIDSTVIQSALSTCRGLEVFNVINVPEQSCTMALQIDEAIQSEWVCTNIRELRIAVWITADGRDPGYFKNPCKSTWTQEERRLWDNLGRLYSQIGALTKLEILDLKAAGELNNVSDIPHTDTCLPALLALDDPTHNKIGYLAKLSGLTKLRELRGSFVWTNPEAKARISEKEVDWFVENLPSLELAMFKHKRDCVDGEEILPDVLQCLRRKRPGLRLVHYDPFIDCRQDWKGWDW